MRPTAASLIALLAAALLAPDAALALDGQITHLSGAVVARRAEGGSRILSLRSEVREGDIVITAESSYARIKWSDGGELVLRPNTQLKIDAYKYDEGSPGADNVLLSLLKGGMRSVTGLLGRRTPSAFRVATPNATIGIRGTHLGALLCNDDCGNVVGPGGGAPPNGLHVDVADGIVFIVTRAGTLDLRAGDFGFVPDINAPPILVPPNQGTRVTLPPQALNQNTQGGSVGRGGNLECAIPR